MVLAVARLARPLWSLCGDPRTHLRCFNHPFAPNAEADEQNAVAIVMREWPVLLEPASHSRQGASL